MSTVRLPVLLVAPALCALGAGETPAFAPEAGTILSKVFKTSVELELDDLSIMANGMDVTDMLGAFEVSLETKLIVEVTDEYVTVSGGRPTKLRRTFDEAKTSTTVEYTSDFESGEEGAELDSLLEGRTVVFEWDAEEDDYVVAFESDEGGDDLLDALSEDMDLRRFLPEGDVDEGDEWSVDPLLLGPILAPGGLLGFRPKGDDEEAMEVFDKLFGADMEDVLKSLLDGRVVCTFKGTEEVGGVEVAVIEIAVEIDSTTDLVEFLETMIEDLGGEIDEEISIERADLSFEVEGQGRLLWDLEGGHFHEFEATGDVSATFELSASGDGQDGEVVIETSGVIELSATHD